MTESDTETRNAVIKRFQGKVSELVLQATDTTFDPRPGRSIPEMYGKVVRYLEKNVVGCPWGDSLILFASIESAQRLDPHTILVGLSSLHARFTALSRSIPIQTWQDWDVDRYLPEYLQGAYTEDADQIRDDFRARYCSAAKTMNRWCGKLSQADQSQYRSLLLPVPTRELIEHLSVHNKITQRQQKKRKSATDAIVPHYHELRAMAHLRFNLLDRILQGYHRALAHMRRCAEQGSSIAYPFEFALDEGGNPSAGLPPTERLHFRIWDRVSFILAHQKDYCRYSVQEARKYSQSGGAYSTRSRNYIFLEYVGAERLLDSAPAEGLWCAEIIRRGFLGLRSQNAKPEDEEWMRAWGYRLTHGSKQSSPFHSSSEGILGWEVGISHSMYKAWRVAEGALLPLEALHAGALFGLLALDIFTTTGMRENELLQIRLTPDECLVRLVLPPPPAARDQGPRIRYVLRLLPKGERTDKHHDYYVSQETVRLMAKVARFLSQSYGVDTAEEIPAVPFNRSHARAHRFHSAPYLFQYRGKHLHSNTIRACLHVLLHGMVLRTQSGESVVVQPHDLRHVFATHAVQVEEIPVDIVGVWLKQKNIYVTKYYSQPTASMAAEVADQFLASVSSHINVAEAIRRSPQELQQMADEALGKVGALANVMGGQCTCSGFCPVQFSCPGCPAHVPNPDQRQQLVHFVSWSQQRVVYAEQEGLYPEAERLQQAIRYAEVELAEMDAIEAYRKDEQRDITLHFDQ